jgi:hypothetical protein
VTAWGLFTIHQKSEAKENTRVKRIMRVVDTAGVRGNSPRFQRGSNRSARFCPAASPMLGVG